MKECRNIYRQAFNDPDTQFEDMLFECCWDDCRILRKNGKTVSMLFALPVIIKTEKENINGAYIYAAATEEESRKKGYMAELLNKVKNDYEFALLRPANEKLIDYYGGFGFKKIITDSNSQVTVIPQSGYKDLLNKSGISDNGEQYIAMYYSNKKLNLEKINFNYSMN